MSELAIVNAKCGYIDLEFRNCLGHDPRPGLEWDRPVVLNGEVVEVVDSFPPACSMIRTEFGRRVTVMDSELIFGEPHV